VSEHDVGAGMALGAGREFDLVRDFVRRWGPLARGIGGDCAVLDLPVGERLVVSTDSSVEDVHFRRDWLAPAEIGYRAAVAALSDLAAAAARPRGLLLALTVPAAWRADAGRLADGVGEAARQAGCPIVGGDLTAGAVLSLTVTVLGSAREPLARRGAGAGDAVFVTGALGGPAAALREWLAGREPAAAHRARFARPVPRLAEARWLAAHGATAAVDLSDGLVADAGHVAAASGVRVRLAPERVPRAGGATLDDALGGGEEYELLVTAPASLDAAAFVAAFGIPLTRVGEVLAGGAPGVEARVDLPGGHDHFSR
jgi:thiamine-monophosphate kinase